jgi:hypothetical protein
MTSHGFPFYKVAGNKLRCLAAVRVIQSPEMKGERKQTEIISGYCQLWLQLTQCLDLFRNENRSQSLKGYLIMPYQLQAVCGVKFDRGKEEVTAKYFQVIVPRLIYMEGRQMQ